MKRYLDKGHGVNTIEDYRFDGVSWGSEGFVGFLGHLEAMLNRVLEERVEFTHVEGVGDYGVRFSIAVDGKGCCE